ncbi:MAG: hypothetical protein RR551_03630 [Mucinivorans sp.]
MEKKNAVQLFEDRKVRTVWDDQQEQWYFSVIDAIAVLTDSLDPKQYIKKMRSRDPELTIDRAVKHLFLKFSPHILIFGILFVVLHYNKSIRCVATPGQVNLRCRQ